MFVKHERYSVSQVSQSQECGHRFKINKGQGRGWKEAGVIKMFSGIEIVAGGGIMPT